MVRTISGSGARGQADAAVVVADVAPLGSTFLDICKSQERQFNAAGGEAATGGGHRSIMRMLGLKK